MSCVGSVRISDFIAISIIVNVMGYIEMHMVITFRAG